MKRILTALCGIALSATLISPAPAHAWPEKPVRIVVPYGPGSTPDALARLIFENVQQATGQPMVVENRPGAAGMIGAATVARAAPDGHTLLLSAAGPLATNTLLYKQMNYDPIADLAPVALVAETPTVLVASKRVQAADAGRLLEQMGDPANRMAYASAGNGTLGHLSLAYLVARSGGDVPHAPYGGSPQIVTALAADDVQLAALPPLAVVPFIEAGRIDAVALVGPRRNALLPDLPTLLEQGVDFAPVGWFGVAAAAGTPQAVTTRIHEAIAKALRDPKVVAYYEAQGMDVADLGPDAFAEYLQEELRRWRPVIEQNNIVLD